MQMDKRFLILVAVFAVLAGTSESPALYQGEYALVLDGPNEVVQGSTESFTARAYDPQGNLVNEVTFNRTFSTLGLVDVSRQMTITKPDGAKIELHGTMTVLVKAPGTDGGPDPDAPPEGAYFTDPTKPSSSVKDATVDVIASAKSEVLVAAYTIESQDVVDALVSAAGRLGPGKVKVVVEEKYYTDPAYQSKFNELKAAGAQIVSDGTKSGSLMHNKFVVVDRETVLSGSTNLTTTQFTGDANNSMVLHDAGLAGAFATEFNEMFSGNFDGGKSDNTQHQFQVTVGGGGAKINVNTASVEELASLPDIGPTTAQKIVTYRETNGPFQSVSDLNNVSGIGSATLAKITPYVTTTGDGTKRTVPVEAYFTPSDDVKNHLLDVINAAKSSISFSIFTFTDPDIADALKAARDRGVKVEGVFDAWQSKSAHSQYDDLLNAGVSVKKDGFTTLNHSKYLVADGGTVVTGSFNWTGSANGENDENLLIIKDSSIAQQYLGNFNTAYAAGK